MSKKIEFNNEARKKLLAGATKLSDAVVSSLGPFGRNTVYTDINGEIRSTKDGVTIARSITLEDPIENYGSEIVKQAAVNSAKQAGDGTTTTTLLAHEMIKQGLSKVDKGANATQIKKEIDQAVKLVVAELKKMSEDIKDEQLKQIATISSNNDEATGNLVATALEKVGVDGVVAIEESKTGETYLETVEGMQFDRGYLSPYFVTNNTTMQGVLDNPLILIYDGIITAGKDIMPLLEQVSGLDKPLLIIAENIDGEALSMLIVNKMRGIIKTIGVKAPDYGERRTLILEDLATLTGGTVISKNKGLKLTNVTINDLGKAEKVTVTKDKTTIIDGKGKTEAIEKRALEIKEQLDKASIGFEKEKLQERLAKLTSGIAVIHVGGNNDIEIKEYKDRVEDALFATKSAIDEGVLPGGGIALFHARKAILNETITVGADIVYKALSKPFTQILENAGKDDIQDYIQILKGETNKKVGYNLRTDSWVDFKETGILDPTKVVRLALENAGSVAGTILTTDCVIFTPVKKEKQEQLQTEDYNN